MRKKISLLKIFAIVFVIIGILAFGLFAAYKWIIPAYLAAKIKPSALAEEASPSKNRQAKLAARVQNSSPKREESTPSAPAKESKTSLKAKKGKQKLPARVVDNAIAKIDSLDNKRVLKVLAQLSEMQGIGSLSAVNFVLDSLGVSEISSAGRKEIAKYISTNDIANISRMVKGNGFLAQAVVPMVKGTIKETLLLMRDNPQ